METHQVLKALRDEVGRVVVGQRGLVDGLLIGLLAGGHVLVEGVPGLAKTTAVRSLAQVLGLGFRRIQFTPDLLPGDLIGTPVYVPEQQRFSVRRGPDLRARDPRRRDQPRARQGAVGAARGDGGAPGHDRRRDARAARPVPGDGDTEPDRARGHLSAARGADRPLPAEARGALPGARTRSARSSRATSASGRPSARSPTPHRCSGCARSPRPCTSHRPSPTTRCVWRARPASRASPGAQLAAPRARPRPAASRSARRRAPRSSWCAPRARARCSTGAATPRRTT